MAEFVSVSDPSWNSRRKDTVSGKRHILGCWKWFNGVLKEANLQVTDANKEQINSIIHKYIGEQSSYGRCSTDWKKARKEINESPKMKNELLKKLKTLV